MTRAMNGPDFPSMALGEHTKRNFTKRKPDELCPNSTTRICNFGAETPIRWTPEFLNELLRDASVCAICLKITMQNNYVVCVQGSENCTVIQQIRHPNLLTFTQLICKKCLQFFRFDTDAALQFRIKGT